MSLTEPPDLVAALRLHLATVYRVELAYRLLERFGSPAQVFQEPQQLARFPGLRPRALASLLDKSWARLAEEEARCCEREGIAILLRKTAGYPEALRPIPDMPLVLFSRGRLESTDVRAVGVVGSRRPTPYGSRQARRFAATLAAHGVTVVSGLARGIDCQAQRTALDEGGRTVAVLGSGLGRIYPPENRALAEAIVGRGRGALVTEFAFSTAPRSFHFPQRNRILSGLSRAVLVVEAGEKSGSLITADWALDQGKDVYVIPGRVDQPQARGALKLLRDGAQPVLDPEDLLGLGLGGGPAAPGSAERHGLRKISGVFGERLEHLFAEEDIWYPDAIAQRLGVPAAELLQELARLELEGYLRRLPGGGLARPL